MTHLYKHAKHERWPLGRVLLYVLPKTKKGLRIPNSRDIFTLHTDVSLFGVGGVLNVIH